MIYDQLWATEYWDTMKYKDRLTNLKEGHNLGGVKCSQGGMVDEFSTQQSY